MQGTRIRLLIGGLLLAGVGGNVHSEALQPDPAWQEGKLDNGLSWQVLATPQRPSDRIELRMLVNTGSLIESTQQTGFAHLLPRLALTQSETLTPGQLQSFFQQVINPAKPLPLVVTSYDYTSYNLSLPNNRPDLLKDSLHWLASTVGKLPVNEATVTQALQSGSVSSLMMTLPVDTGDAWWRYRLKGSTLLGHDPGKTPAAPVDANQLKSFYHQWYTPDAVTLYVVGNVDGRALNEQIARAFSSLQGKRETPATVPTLSPLPTTPVALISDVLKQDDLSLIWDTPWQPIRDSQAMLRYWRSDLAREALFWHLKQALGGSALKNSVNLSFDCQVQYQRSQCGIHLLAPQASMSKALNFVAAEMAVLREKGIDNKEFTALIEQKNGQLARLFATYARTDTDILMSQRLRSQQSGVVDISPEAYQKLRQEFLNTASLEVLNQELRVQLSRQPTLVLRQPRGEEEGDVKALAAAYNQALGLASDDVAPPADVVPADTPAATVPDVTPKSELTAPAQTPSAN